jgi:hypothetical protein
MQAAGSPFDQGYSGENRKGSEERLANSDEPVSRIGFSGDFLNERMVAFSGKCLSFQSAY